MGQQGVSGGFESSATEPETAKQVEGPVALLSTSFNHGRMLQALDLDQEGKSCSVDNCCRPHPPKKQGGDGRTGAVVHLAKDPR